MDLQSMIKNAVAGNVSSKISTATGAHQSAVEQVIQAGLPVILGQLGNNASTTDGANQLDAAVTKDHTGGSLLDSLSGLFGGGDTNTEGGKILNHVLGSNQDTLNTTISQKTGVDAATVGKILSFLAPIVMASLGKQKTTNNLDAGGLSRVLQQQTHDNGSLLTEIASAALSSPAAGNMINSVLGGLFKRG